MGASRPRAPAMPHSNPTVATATPMTAIVRVAIIAVTIALFLQSTLHGMLGHRDIAVLSALAAPLGISAWAFARAGHNEAAIVFLSCVLLTVVTLVLVLSPLGVHDVAITAYGGIVLVASLLLSRRNFSLVTVLTLLAAATAFAIDLPGGPRVRPLHDRVWLQFIVFLVVTGVFATIARAASEMLFSRIGDAQRAAAGDDLTGLANRVGFERKASRVLRRAAVGGGSCVLVLAELEGFRRLKVMVGYDAADRIVAEAAHRVTSIAGEELVARLSEHEFALLARDLPRDGGAEELARKVREALDFEFSGVSVRSTVGFACFPRDAERLDALLLAAEASLLAAKPAAMQGAPSRAADRT